MANEIYKQTHKGLAEMISARAATNVLQKALKANACDADIVDYNRMKSCLQGYVFEELRNVLPSHGLKRQIKGILRGISTLETNVAVAEPEVAAISSGPAESAVEGLVEQAAIAVSEPPTFISNQTDVAAAKEVFTDAVKSEATVVEVEDFDNVFSNPVVKEDDVNASLDLIVEDIDLIRIGESESRKTDDDISDDLFDAVSQGITIVDEEELPELVLAKTANVATSVTKKPMARKKSKESVDFSSKEVSDLEELLQVFALVEGTRAVAIVSAKGKLVSSRGRGYDLDNLAILSNMALQLLKKSGDIRSYHLYVDDSQLFLFPVAEHLIVVVGSEEINFGEIVSAFAAFEEEI